MINEKLKLILGCNPKDEKKGKCQCKKLSGIGHENIRIKYSNFYVCERNI